MRALNGSLECQSLDEWVRTLRLSAMPVETPVNVNHVLILSNLLPGYHGVRLPLAKLFSVQMGGSSWVRVWATK
jgi:hypothetical protein